MARKPVKPTIREKVIIESRLREKYPQMFKPGWGKKRFESPRTKQIKRELKAAKTDWEKEKPSARFRRSKGQT